MYSTRDLLAVTSPFGVRFIDKELDTEERAHGHSNPRTYLSTGSDPLDCDHSAPCTLLSNKAYVAETLRVYLFNLGFEVFSHRLRGLVSNSTKS